MNKFDVKINWALQEYLTDVVEISCIFVPLGNYFDEMNNFKQNPFSRRKVNDRKDFRMQFAKCASL